MPYFMNLLSRQAELKSEQIKGLFSCSAEILDVYRDSFLRRWNGFTSNIGREIDGEVLAIDSSNGAIEVSGGGTILITRAYGLSNRGKEVKNLLLDVLYPKSVRDYDEYKRFIREHLEHQVAYEALDSLSKGDYLLFDGSLYGRMLHVIRELDLPGKESFILEYIDLYHEMITKALSKGVALVGVSKDTRSTLLKEELLREKLLDLLNEAESYISTLVRELWGLLKRRPRDAVSEVQELYRSGMISKDIYEMFLEARSPVPDSKLIMLLQLGEGYSTPVKVNVLDARIGIMESILTKEDKDLENTIESVFPQSFTRRGDAFVKEGLKVIRKVMNYPPCITFYVVLSNGDIPLRIDLISNEVPKASVEAPLRFVKDHSNLVKDVLSVLRALYGGPKHYNVLLEHVDRKVKMHYNTVETYKRFLEKKLGLLITRSRGERRVSYP
jgi:hypothetical protein